MPLTDSYSLPPSLRRTLVTVATLGAAVGFSIIPIQSQKDFRGVGYSLASMVEDREKHRLTVATHRRRGLSNRRPGLPLRYAA